MANNPTNKSNEIREGLQSRIAARAYALYLKEGRPHGRALQHWLAAEAQLRTPPPVVTPAAKRQAKPLAHKPAKPARLEFVLQNYE